MFKEYDFNETPNVSVIVPVYNAEKYVSQCLDSLINQTLTNIEIICVNDGSTDDSLKILQEYENKDSRIKVFDKHNGGAGSARNLGLKEASGQYINFVDSDDWLDLETYEILFNKCNNENLDVVFFQLINYDDETKEFYEDNSYNVSQIPDSFDNKVFSHLDIKDVLFYLSVSPCNKLYKYEILEDMSFPEGVMFEDNPFFFEAFLKTKRVGIVREHFYFRRRHSNSVMTNRGKKLIDAIEISNKIVDAVKNSGYYEIYKDRVLNHKFMMVRNWYNHVNEENKQEYFMKIKEDSLDIKLNTELFNEYETLLSFDKKIFFHNSTIAETYKEFDLLNVVDGLKRELNSVKHKNNELQNKNSLFSNQFSSLFNEFMDIQKLTITKIEEYEKNDLYQYLRDSKELILNLKFQNECLEYQNESLHNIIKEMIQDEIKDEIQTSNKYSLKEYLSNNLNFLKK